MRVLGLALAVGLSGCALYEGPPEPSQCHPTAEDRAIGSMDVPTTGTETAMTGQDVDGDGDIDNQLGSIWSSLISSLGIPADETSARISSRLGTDEFWTVTVLACPEGVTAHYSSDGVPIGLFFDFADAGVSPFLVFADANDGPAQLADGRLDMLIAGTLPPGYSEAAANGFQPYAQEQVAMGTLVGDALDTNNDGTVTIEEIMANSIWQELMAPDVDTDGDGTAESLSFGFHVYPL